MFKIILVLLASLIPLTGHAEAPNTTTKSMQHDAATVNAPAGLVFMNAWTRPVTLIPDTVTNTAVYLSIKSDTAAEYTLINASSDIANRTEIHQTITEDNKVSKMVKIANVAIPGKGVVDFKPGGAHIMLYDLKRSLNSGDKFKVTLFFSDGSASDVEVQALSSAPTTSSK